MRQTLASGKQRQRRYFPNTRGLRADLGTDFGQEEIDPRVGVGKSLSAKRSISSISCCPRHYVAKIFGGMKKRKDSLGQYAPSPTPTAGLGWSPTPRSQVRVEWRFPRCSDVPADFRSSPNNASDDPLECRQAFCSLISVKPDCRNAMLQKKWSENIQRWH